MLCVKWTFLTSYSSDGDRLTRHLLTSLCGNCHFIKPFDKKASLKVKLWVPKTNWHNKASVKIFFSNTTPPCST